MDDPNRNTYAPAKNPRPEREEGREPSNNDSEEAMAREGFRTLDRARRSGDERRGLSTPVYTGFGPYDFDDY